MTRFYVAIYREIFIGNWAIPNFVITFSIAHEIASVVTQNPFEFGRETTHESMGALQTLIKTNL
jgi:hypothetical protein